MGTITKTRSKRIDAAYKLLTQDLYTLDEAISLTKKTATAKFDETIEFIAKLGIDTKQSDQVVRGVINLPSGTGKSVRVAVICKDDKQAEAKEAGADLVGGDDLIETIKNGEINFDRCIATPDMMGKIGAIARVLGPKGLMPNPKLGTVTNDIGEAVRTAKAGSVEYRAEKGGILHIVAGKASFTLEALKDNINTIFQQLAKSKPSGAKGTFILAVFLSSTMGPSVRIDLASFNK